MKRLSFSLSLVLFTAGLGSCAGDKTPDSVPSGGPAAAVKTTRNTQYQTPPVQGPVPRNPDMNLPSGGKSSGITFSRVNVAGKYIAMTYDDGPHATQTPRLLDMLRARNIKATFFCVGQNVNLYPGIARQIVAEGHEIANHSYSHALLTKLGDPQYHAELSRTHDAIIKATGVTPRVMRPPYGALLQRQREWAHSTYGYPTVLWSVDPFDWKRPGAAAISSRILSATTQGGIILAHDIHAQTVDAMPNTLDTLLRRGYRFVTVSQLLAMQQSSSAAPAPEPATLPAP